MTMTDERLAELDAVMTIPLTQGKVAIVDAADYEWLSQWKWCASRRGDTFRVQRAEYLGYRSQRSIFMHRAIMRPDAGSVVDHINHDPLDNRRANLRVCSQSENVRNRTSANRSSSKFLGVGWYARNSKWHARIQVNGLGLHIGYYDDETEAARSYDAAARLHFGDFANLNFKDAA